MTPAEIRTGKNTLKVPLLSRKIEKEIGYSYIYSVLPTIQNDCSRKPISHGKHSSNGKVLRSSFFLPKNHSDSIFTKSISIPAATQGKYINAYFMICLRDGWRAPKTIYEIDVKADFSSLRFNLSAPPKSLRTVVYGEGQRREFVPKRFYIYYFYPHC